MKEHLFIIHTKHRKMLYLKKKILPKKLNAVQNHHLEGPIKTYLK